MKLLIDADVISYRAGFATDRTKYLAEYGNGTFANFDDAKTANETEHFRLWSRKESEPEDKALMLVDVMIRDILARYEFSEAKLYLSGVGNFRHGLATRASYKGNRSGQTPPKHLKAIRQHLISKWSAVVSAGEEADDLIGIAMTSSPDSICCSIDKDLMQLPGRHYNFVTKEEVTVNKKEASLNFYAQVLSGDSTDNIPGLTGYGPVKAKKALADCKNPAQCWERCLSLYTWEFKEELGPAYAVEAARLVYVRRYPGELWPIPSSGLPVKSAA